MFKHDRPDNRSASGGCQGPNNSWQTAELVSGHIQLNMRYGDGQITSTSSPIQVIRGWLKFGPPVEQPAELHSCRARRSVVYDKVNGLHWYPVKADAGIEDESGTLHMRRCCWTHESGTLHMSRCCWTHAAVTSDKTSRSFTTILQPCRATCILFAAASIAGIFDFGSDRSETHLIGYQDLNEKIFSEPHNLGSPGI